jgi:hypothetical protein
MLKTAAGFQPTRAVAASAAIIQASLQGAPLHVATHGNPPISIFSTLLQKVSYVPPRRTRNLWLELVATAAGYLQVEVPEWLRPAVPTRPAHLAEPDVSGSSESWDPDAWPHWVGQLDVRLIMDTQPYPAHEIPPQVQPYLRIDHRCVIHSLSALVHLRPPWCHVNSSRHLKLFASRSSGGRHYLPMLAANPVRPTRERYHPVNGSVSMLPLHITLRPTSVGKQHMCP